MKKISKDLLTASALLALTAACAAPQASTEALALTCPQNDVRQSCILGAAGTALAEIEDDRDWIAAAAEYALALDASSREAEARATLNTALDKTSAIADTGKQVAALLDIANAAAEIGASDLALQVIATGEGIVRQIGSEDKQVDLLGKFASAQAASGEIKQALAKAGALRGESENAASFKARTLREIAVHQAKAGDFSGAAQTISKITDGLTYYWSTARSDVAELAFAAGEKSLANRWLAEADKIARAQDDGYFIAGALRDIGKARYRGGEREAAMRYFEDAKDATANAKSAQHKARSLSRVGTGLADCGLYAEAQQVIPAARERADQAKSPIFKNFSFYEIAGSAAFAGDFNTANQLIALIPDMQFSNATSLKGATKRDVAWGLARHGQTQSGVVMASGIAKPRERVQALSRIVRLLAEPKMDAFPRYL